MALLRSLVHVLWMFLTVVPYAIAILVLSPFARPYTLYRIARGWLAQVMRGLTVICGPAIHFILPV